MKRFVILAWLMCQVSTPALCSETFPPVPPSGVKKQEELPRPRAILEPRIEPLPDVRGGESYGVPAALPITLQAALRLAQASNLDIAQAQAAMSQAYARSDRARLAILPNFNIGTAYNHHEGNIQATAGNIQKVNRDSLFVGGGPSLVFQTSELIFGRLALEQLAAASYAGLQRVNNDTLLSVADAYLNILRIERRIARLNDTLDDLLSDQPSPLRAQSRGMLPLVRDFVELGAKEVFPADLERVRVEILRRQEELEGARQDLRLNTAELARLLRLDPGLPLQPLEDFRNTVPIPGEEWSSRPLEELVAVALRNRPEIAENEAFVQAAVERVRAARFRPWLPNVALNDAFGDFGGSPDQQTRGAFPSGRIKHFGTRTEVDASVFWRFEALGLGNRAEQRAEEAVYRGVTYRQLQAQDRVVTQVVQALELVRAWRERVAITRAALFDADGAPTGPVFRAIRLSFDRVRGGEGRPLELLDSIRSLSDALESYGQAMTEYERAHFRLLIALGLPPQSWFNPNGGPFPFAAMKDGCTPNH
jgi:outer membrane protein TolC